MSEQYSIKIPVFEGPLDLLLHLIKKNEVDIYDIPVALITGQYLEYLGLMKELNLEIAGEFLVMAATLIQIKSRMLLPEDEQEPEAPAEDPRLELVQRLLEYQAFKEASLDLKEIGQKWADVLYRQDAQAEEEGGEEEDSMLELFDLSMFDLISAFKKILEKAPPELQLISRETLTVNDRISRIIAKLEEKETVRFEEFFEPGEAPTKTHMIITFVAILEILKLGLASVYQEEKFGPIWVVRAKEVAEEGPVDHGNAGLPPEDFSFLTAGEQKNKELRARRALNGDADGGPSREEASVQEEAYETDLDEEAWYREAPDENGETNV